MAESVLDRKFAGNLTVEKTIYLVVFLAALLLRTIDLGQRPYHHDESIHAYFSWKILDDGFGSYRYDPVYHGPLLYYSSAAVMGVFGDSDFTGRLSAVLFGLGVLAFAWPLRRYLGRWGAITFLVLLTFSPSFNYFSRFVRHDIYMALCNLAMVYCLFRYGETRTVWYLYGAGAALALAFCTKEDMYAMGPVFILALVLMMAWEVVYGKRTARDVWRESIEVLGASVLPLITTLVIFAVIWLIFYTSFGTHPELWNGVTRALSYWWGQHEIKRIGGPWWYYLPQFTLYDPIIFYGAFAVVLVPFLRPGVRDKVLGWMRWGALVGVVVFIVLLTQRSAAAPLVLVGVLGMVTIGVARIWLPDRFTRYAILWAFGALCFYGWAQEKVPWLLVPQILPLAIVASVGIARSIETGTIRVTAIPLGVLGALTLWTLVQSSYFTDAPRPDEPSDKRTGELLAYVQSTYDINKVVKRIDEISATLGIKPAETKLAISGNATWPFSWNLRHYPVNWASNVRSVDVPVVIVDKEVTKSMDEALGKSYDKIPFQIRGWWEPNWQDATPTNVVKFLLQRRAWSPTGSSDAVMYVHKDLKPGMQFAKVEVNPPPSARDYPSDAGTMVAAAAIWGREGTAPGQFREPRGLATDAAGDVYVVDSKNSRIQKLDPQGNPIAVWGSEGSEQGQFKDPCGVAVGPDGSVYVADTWNHRIQKFDPNGKFITEWNETDPSLWGPRGITVSKEGTVFVTDTGNKRVVSYGSTGQKIESWGGDGSKPGQLIEPVGIAVNDEGNVVVADTGNRRLQFFQPDGTFVAEWQVFGWEEFYTEPYVATHGGDVWVTDSFNHRFALYRGGKIAGSWGKTGSGSGEFNRPIGIAVDGSGNVFVSDTLNNRIQKFVGLGGGGAAAGG